MRFMPFSGSGSGRSRHAQPVRIGSTLALTGPLAPAGNIQKVAIETFIEDLNGRGGLLGRKVEWVLKDDQSRPDLARTLYEQLATVDKVDLLMGPYGTASILSAMGVAQRYNKILIHNSFGTPKLAKYDMQFSASGGAGDPEVVWLNLAFDAAAAAPKPPKTVAIVTSKFPARTSSPGRARGGEEARPAGGAVPRVGVRQPRLRPDREPHQGRQPRPRLRRRARPRRRAASRRDEEDRLPAGDALLYLPAPGPMLKLPEAKNALALTTFEEHPPFTSDAAAARYVAGFRERAAKAALPSTSPDLLGRSPMPRGRCSRRRSTARRASTTRRSPPG